MTAVAKTYTIQLGSSCTLWRLTPRK